jgi:hypothetical protein
MSMAAPGDRQHESHVVQRGVDGFGAFEDRAVAGDPDDRVVGGVRGRAHVPDLCAQVADMQGYFVDPPGAVRLDVGVDPGGHLAHLRPPGDSDITVQAAHRALLW